VCDVVGIGGERIQCNICGDESLDASLDLSSLGERGLITGLQVLVPQNRCCGKWGKLPLYSGGGGVYEHCPSQNVSNRLVLIQMPVQGGTRDESDWS